MARRLLIAAAAGGLASADSSGVWPAPKSAEGGSARVQVLAGKNFFSAEDPADEFLNQAFARYSELTFPHAISSEKRGGVGIEGFYIEIEEAEDGEAGLGYHPQLDTDESYSLEVSDCSAENEGPCRAYAKAKTRYGALRALETFSQLVTFDFDSESYVVAGAPWRIEDAPRFPHRGLMVDSGRHFLPLPVLRKVIDSMPYAKLNVLHWHMSDTQSFPFQSKSSPELWKAAFSPGERYTQADVGGIVEYARLRGIRVMVEFDMPGHAGSWCVGRPEVCPSQSCTQPLNLANNKTFEAVEALLNEVTGGRKYSGLFPEHFLHLGGDEVDTTCWAKTPSVSSWLKAHGMTPHDGYKYFVNRAASMAISMGRRPVQWSEVWDNFKEALPKESIVHVWKENTNVTEVVAKGYSVIRNVGYDKISWYLDNLNVKWSAVYNNEPCAGIPTEELCSKVLGGHGEMWGETVDGSDIEATVWPRLAAIAEKLWSPRAATQSADDALPRIKAFRCLLLSRGVAAAVPENAAARAAPPGPGGCAQRPKMAAAAPLKSATLYA